jgi:hypothetical protein
MEKESKQKAVLWFGDISNITALLAVAIVVTGLINYPSKLLIILGLGTLILVVFLKNADVRRFKDVIQSCEDIPPLGLAKGSVRSLLAFGFLAGLGLYIYYATKPDDFKAQIFTALSSIISAIAGFYFGSKAAVTAPTTAKAPAPEVTGIEPDYGEAGTDVKIDNIAGTGFQADAAVSLILGTANIPAEDVNVVNPTKIKCIFKLKLPIPEVGKWNVVVTNPDGQKDSLVEGFEIRPITSP